MKTNKAKLAPTDDQCPDCGNGPFRLGAVLKESPCGCTVAGWGTLRDPWHIHYCAAHKANADMLEALKMFAAVDWARAQDCNSYLELAANKARAAIAKAEQS